MTASQVSMGSAAGIRGDSPWTTVRSRQGPFTTGLRLPADAHRLDRTPPGVDRGSMRADQQQ